MNVAILGGRFDPPHWGHFWVAHQVLELGPKIDQVWLMPTFQHPWKKAVAAAQDRKNMLQYLTTDNIKVSSIEIDRGGISYTIDTVNFLKTSYPNDKFYWIVGSDALSDFSKWHAAQKISLSIPFLVYPRGDYPIKLIPFGMKKIAGDFVLQTNLSSTYVRQRLEKGFSITGLVPAEIENYIHSKHLYR